MNRQRSDPNTSLKRSIGSSDGRCVQRAGTQSTQADDLRLLGIPGSRGIIASPDPYHEGGSAGYPSLSGRGRRHAEPFSVARVRPRTSKGITDLLLLSLVRLDAASPSKKKIFPAVRAGREADRCRELVSRTESRSLSQSSRQITPPTKNGHAPPPTESRKSSQSVNPSSVRAW